MVDLASATSSRELGEAGRRLPQSQQDRDTLAVAQRATEALELICASALRIELGFGDPVADDASVAVLAEEVHGRAAR